MTIPSVRLSLRHGLRPRSTMPKRPADERGGGRKVKRRRRHLYLVIDDWEWGYSIRKFDLSSDFDSDDDELPHQQITAVTDDGAIDWTEQRLPPAVFRLEAPRGFSEYFAAFGTKIMATHLMAPKTNTHPLVPRCFAPVFDVRTRGLIFGPRPKVADPIYVSIGDKLFALGDGSFHLLYPPPPLEGPCVWFWLKLRKPPFKRKFVTSHAVHPDGRTIFVSTTVATFTVDTAEDTEESFEWKRHGKWTLPFTGRAYFDRELEAWVGLSGDPNKLGYLCSCDVASADAGASDRQPPAWKLSKEKLFSRDPTKNHIGVTLVHMVGRSKFCLVQCISIYDDCHDENNYYKWEENLPQPCRHLLRLTTFSLKYDKKGDLTLTHRLVRHYELPYAVTDYLLERPVAFWM